MKLDNHCPKCGKSIILSGSTESLKCRICQKYTKVLKRIGRCEENKCASLAPYIKYENEEFKEYCLLHSSGCVKKYTSCQYVGCAINYLHKFSCKVFTNKIKDFDDIMNLSVDSVERLKDKKETQCCTVHHNLEENICQEENCIIVASHGNIGYPPIYCKYHKKDYISNPMVKFWIALKYLVKENEKKIQPSMIIRNISNDIKSGYYDKLNITIDYNLNICNKNPKITQMESIKIARNRFKSKRKNKIYFRNNDYKRKRSRNDNERRPISKRRRIERHYDDNIKTMPDILNIMKKLCSKRTTEIINKCNSATDLVSLNCYISQLDANFKQITTKDKKRNNLYRI